MRIAPSRRIVSPLSMRFSTICTLPEARSITTPYSRVVALDPVSGAELWSFTLPAGSPSTRGLEYWAGDGKTRGWIAALDARSGKELWRWYAVPAPGEPGSETWKDKNQAWKTGGGGLWQTGSYDPVTRLTIWGTGNPVPIYDPDANYKRVRYKWIGTDVKTVE